MKFLPSADRLLVKPEPIENVEAVTDSETRRQIAQTGHVVAVGPGREINGTVFPVACDPNQLVAFLQASGCELSIDGTTFVILQERDLLGTFADDEGKVIFKG